MNGVFGGGEVRVVVLRVRKPAAVALLAVDAFCLVLSNCCCSARAGTGGASPLSTSA